jgi:uncharacterized repeat protein (TIGR03917 family)
MPGSSSEPSDPRERRIPAADGRPEPSPPARPRRPRHVPVTLSWQTGVGFEITLRPGAAPDELADRLRVIPASMVFTEAFGDVDVVLVFRGEPGAPAPAAPVAPRPDSGPARRRSAARTRQPGRAAAGRPGRRPATTSRNRPAGPPRRRTRRDDGP